MFAAAVNQFSIYSKEIARALLLKPFVIFIFML